MICYNLKYIDHHCVTARCPNPVRVRKIRDHVTEGLGWESPNGESSNITVQNHNHSHTSCHLDGYKHTIQYESSGATGRSGTGKRSSGSSRAR